MINYEKYFNYILNCIYRVIVCFTTFYRGLLLNLCTFCFLFRYILFPELQYLHFLFILVLLYLFLLKVLSKYSTASGLFLFSARSFWSHFFYLRLLSVYTTIRSNGIFYYYSLLFCPYVKGPSRLRIILRDSGLEPKTVVSANWCSTNQPPKIL